MQRGCKLLCLVVLLTLGNADMSAKTLIAFTIALYDGFLAVGVSGVDGAEGVLGVVVGVDLGLDCVVVCAAALLLLVLLVVLAGSDHAATS